MSRRILTSRRGLVAALVALLLVVILVSIAMAIDICWLTAAIRQEQVATDNCALATAAFIADQGIQTSKDDRQLQSEAAAAYGASFMPVNPVEHIALIPDVVQTGQAAWVNGAIVFVADSENYNAVRVAVTMARNQRLPALLGSLVGRDYYEPFTESIALLQYNNGGVLPFTINRDAWDAQIAAGVDDWAAIDLSTEPQRDSNGDGIPEIVLYPQAHDCAGNAGTLSINRDNQGLVGLSEHIEQNVGGSDLEAEVGPFEFDIHTRTYLDSSGHPLADEDGNALEFPVAYFIADGGLLPEITLRGNPGLSFGTRMREALQHRIGDIVGVFVHDDCDGGGAQAEYTITAVRYCRILGFDLGGNKAIYLQPTTEDPRLVSQVKIIGLIK